METYGAKVAQSPGETTEFGRDLLEREPDHPGSEATAVSEALEVVRRDPTARYALGAFANFVLTHQTVIGLEAREQLESIDREPDYLVASIGCGSNLGGFTLPWVPDKLAGQDVEIVAAEPAACPTLTQGEYRYDVADATGSGPMVRTYTLGHDFVPPPIHAGGLRYHGAAPIAGLMHNEEMLRAVAYEQETVFEAGQLFARLTGLVPAPETCHAIRATIDVANECRERGERKTIAFCYSGHGLLDLAAYDRYAAGAMHGDAEGEPAELLAGATAGGVS
jgi:tryptophan synthase beta chain